MQVNAAVFFLCVLFLTASQYTKAIDNVEYYYNLWDPPQGDSVYTNIEYKTSSFQSNSPIGVRDRAEEYKLPSSSERDYADSNEDAGGLGKGTQNIIRRTGFFKNIQTSIRSTIANANRRYLSIKLQAIFPGTLWCGDGNVAKSDKEVGYFRETDKCCREHDMCPVSIVAGEEKLGLYNGGTFTRSHCDCDYKFFACLDKANTLVSRKMAFTYFTVLGPQCFKEEHPIKECKVRHFNRCMKYIVDGTKPKIWQWFDNKEYIYNTYIF